MTCKQLGGACEEKFQAETLEDIAELSKLHGLEMFQKQEPLHLQAMAEIEKLMQQPQAMQAWFLNKKSEFDALPED